MRRYSSPFIIAFVFQLLTFPAFAQMFSVGESSGPATISNSYLKIGLAPTAFDYDGESNDPGTSLLELENNAFFIGFESPGVELNLTLANQLSGLENKSFFDLNFTLSNRFYLINKRNVRAGIPLQLHSSITSVNNNQIEENFNQANFAIGGGGFLNIRIGEKLTFNNEATPGYGFSNSSGGFLGGSMYYLKTKSRLTFIGLIGGRSIGLGYDYNFRSFDIDDDFYDFDLTSHTITLAISL